MEFLEQLKRVTKYSGIEQSSQVTKEDIGLLEQVALGRTNKEIADILFLSQRAIEYRLTNIYEKLEKIRHTSSSFYQSHSYDYLKDNSTFAWTHTIHNITK